VQVRCRGANCGYPGGVVDQAELQTGLAGLVRGYGGWETEEALQGKRMAREGAKGTAG
jgi:hypothetical protein